MEKVFHPLREKDKLLLEYTADKRATKDVYYLIE